MKWKLKSNAPTGELVSTPMRMVKLLVVCPQFYKEASVGYFFVFGDEPVWRLDGSPSDFGKFVTHWMPMPPMPKYQT